MEINDIKTLLYQVKDNIKKVESGEFTQETLDDISHDFISFLDLCKLFLISNRGSYYGYLLMNMEYEIIFNAKIIAGIKLNTNPPVFCTNPLLLGKMSLREILFAICHEIDHLVYNHPTEMAKINPNNDPRIAREFNIAADACVNDLIKKEIKKDNKNFLLAPKGIITSRRVKSLYSLPTIKSCQSYLYYYNLIHVVDDEEEKDSVINELLKSNKDNMLSSESSDNGSGKNGQNDPKDESQDSSGGDDTSGSKDGSNESSSGDNSKLDNPQENLASGEKEEKESSSSNGSDDPSSESVKSAQQVEKSLGGEKGQNDSTSIEEDSDSDEEVVTANSDGDYEDHNWDIDDEDEANEAIKNLMNTSFDSMDEETRGLMPANFVSQIKKINEVAKISWEKLLKRYVGTLNDGYISTRRRLNRRQPKRFDLSGKMADKVLKIVVAIDTSGSVNEKMLQKIFTEIFAITAKRKKEITVIECDSKVQKVYKMKKASDFQFDVLGRGGTSFTPVIEYINEHREYRDALLVYFTDGFGESKIPKPRTYRNMWVIIGKKEDLSIKEPYGIVIDF